MGGDLVPFRRRSGRAGKHDWGAAWLYFAADPNRKLKEVADHCKISPDSVYRFSAKHGWVKKRQELLGKVTANQEQVMIKSLQERHRQTIMVADKLRDTILADDATIEVKDAVSALPAYAKLEQLFGGGATENLRALPMINPDNLTLEEIEELARLLEKGRGEEEGAA